mgnify:CR=1 FL=1
MFYRHVFHFIGVGLIDKDIYLLSICSYVQERRFIPSLAALLSIPWASSATVKFKDHFMKLIGNVQALILLLVSSRSGLL